ncbi:MAG: Fe-S cluster assembly protein SufD, partial [Proteobacteria bacterium]
MNLLSTFDAFQKGINSPDAEGARKRAAEYARTTGLPTRKNEDWKYTSVKVLDQENFVPALTDARPTHEQMLAVRQLLNPDFINIVFHNGILDQTLSSVDQLPPGIRLDARALASDGTFKDTFDALNVAYAATEYSLTIAKETSCATPIHLLFYSANADEQSVMSHPRLRIEAGERSSAHIIESYYGQEKSRYFSNTQAHVVVGPSANITYVRVQSESSDAINIGRTQFRLCKGSTLHSLAYSTGAKLSRHDVEVELSEMDSTSTIDGVYLVRDQQHVDNTTVIDHRVGACNSSQHYKGILADRSRAVFNGKVMIQKGAMKANSQQLNNNLLLSQQAEADSRPQLQIYADDVKAAHGSTVGQLNSEELFYLQSRAISEADAIPMLAFGYV